MNANAQPSPDDLARACADAMWKDDDASRGLGMKIIEIKPGQATLTMTVAPHMVNGQRIAHGGFIFTLADSAFAFACNSHNERVVAAQGSITFIQPGKLGDRLVATAREISRAVATSTSPSLPGRMKVMLPWAATARSLWLLQAKANAESASAKMKPPWAMRWPLTMCGSTVIVSVAWPGLISMIFMPRPRLASSSFHIASAQARATSSGDKVALTFTSELPVSGLLEQASQVVC